MSGPAEKPIGMQLAETAKAVSRAFDARLGAAGGSRPKWLILLSLRSGSAANQRELADAVGIRGATLTHHLNAMESEGLLTRRRDPGNRRVHVVELTSSGATAFDQLRGAARAHDAALRDGLDDRQLATLRDLLGRLGANVAEGD